MSEGRFVRYGNFDLLRLFLAMEVVVDHVHGFLKGFLVPIWLPLNPVPCFLAISGFMVLGSITRTGKIGRFWWRRALRIVPAFTVGIFLVLALEGVTGLGRAMICYVTGGIYNIGVTPNAPLWSLSCEEVAYGLMCFLFLIGFYKNQRWSIAAGIVTACIYGWGVHTYGMNRIHWLALAPCFFIGCAFIPIRTRAAGVLGLAFIAIAGSCQFLPLRYFPPGVPHTVAVCAGALGVLFLGGSSLRLPKLPIDISYGVYIFHFPILYWMVHRGHLSAPWFIVIGITAPVALSIASAILVEQPALRLKEWSPGRKTTRTGNEAGLTLPFQAELQAESIASRD